MNHSEKQIIGDMNKGVWTRRQLIKDSEQSHISFLYMIEPKKIYEVSKHDD
jgi:hypothetical protein